MVRGWKACPGRKDAKCLVLVWPIFLVSINAPDAQQSLPSQVEADVDMHATCWVLTNIKKKSLSEARICRQRPPVGKYSKYHSADSEGVRDRQGG